MSDSNHKKTGQRSRPSIKYSDPMSEKLASPDAKSAPGLLAAYHPRPGTYDELLAETGELRPHYASLIGALEKFSPAELQHRRDTSRRLVLEQGITYNVYDDPRGMERPWQLDLLPFLIAPAEWRALEAALVQRATLLNRILKDCYGPQDLIRSRW